MNELVTEKTNFDKLVKGKYTANLTKQRDAVICQKI